MVLEYNPTKGHDTPVGYPENHGIGGEILDAKKRLTKDPITSIQIVGNGVVGSWKLEDAQEMTYNKNWTAGSTLLKPRIVRVKTTSSVS